MAQAAPARTKIPTETPQLLHSGPARRVGRPKKGNRTARSWVIASGTGRATTRGSGEVIELECGITVYPAREEHGRWRAVWYENGDRRQCEAASEAKLAARLEKVAERLEADAPNMSRPGADLIAHYLDPADCRPGGNGPASTRPRSAGYVSGSPSRSSVRSSARTSPSGTCSRSSTPPRRPGKAAASRA